MDIFEHNSFTMFLLIFRHHFLDVVNTISLLFALKRVYQYNMLLEVAIH